MAFSFLYPILYSGNLCTLENIECSDVFWCVYVYDVLSSSTKRIGTRRFAVVATAKGGKPFAHIHTRKHQMLLWCFLTTGFYSLRSHRRFHPQFRPFDLIKCRSRPRCAYQIFDTIEYPSLSQQKSPLFREGFSCYVEALHFKLTR